MIPKNVWIYLKSVYRITKCLPSSKFLMNHWPLVSLNNQPCQAKPTLVDTNSNEKYFNPFNKCGENCNAIDDT